MCGICGIFGHKDAAQLSYLSLFALQHRGEESAGIVTYDGKKTHSYKGMGLVGDIFNEANLKSLRGHLAIGHNRYSTTGSSVSKNIQPLLVNYRKFPIAVAHNGNLTNAYQLRDRLEKEGSIFQTSLDSEIILHLLVKSPRQDRKQKIIEALSQIEGAYSLVLMIDNTLVGARDPYGFRPLCLGELNGAYILASETCALDLLQATYIRDIQPGEVVFIDNKGIDSIKPFTCGRCSYCIFEYIYFARPDSNIFGRSVYLTRKRLGRKMAQENPGQADFVSPIPDSGNYAALGFAQEANLPFEMAMVRNHYVGRTFIQPSQLIRDFRVKVKLNPIKGILQNKRIILVEDSIVRGTTSRSRVRTIREAGAKEIHMRISCPPLRFACFYGIDFPTQRELIASGHSVEWIRDFIGVDTLQYLSLEGMLEAMDLPRENFCTACFNGDYPVKISKKISKKMLEK
jgi:amidophosphoribosyltransferase